jgi:hypothetical protein
MIVCGGFVFLVFLQHNDLLLNADVQDYGFYMCGVRATTGTPAIFTRTRPEYKKRNTKMIQIKKKRIMCIL